MPPLNWKPRKKGIRLIFKPMGEDKRKSALLYDRTPEKLMGKCRRLLGALGSSGGAAVYADLTAWNIPSRRSDPRVGFVWDSREKAMASLENVLAVLSSGNPPEAWEDNSGGVYRSHGVDPRRQKLVAVFSGQGTLYANMGRRLMGSFPILEQGFSHMGDVMAQSGLMPIFDLLFPAEDLPAAKKRQFFKYLHETQYAQPAIGVFTAGLYRIMEALGFEPAFVGGLSFGEVLALWAGRVFSDSTFFKVVNGRGMAMALPPSEVCGEGAMMAVTGTMVERIIPWMDPVPDVVVEAWNSHNQLVLSGLKSRLEDIQFTLQEKGFDAFILPVSGAFHSPFMKNASQAFAETMNSISLHRPELDVYSNLTAAPYPSRHESIRKMLADHIIKPVRFKEMIINIHKQGGFTFVEFGPKKILTGLIDNILEGRPHLALPLNSGNRRRTQYALRPPLGVLAQFDNHPLIPCIVRNVSRDGLRLEGLPRSLAARNGPVQVQLRGLGGKQNIVAALMWRQARYGGVKISDPIWAETLFQRLVNRQSEDCIAGPDKDSDRQLRETIIKLMVYGYELKPLDCLLKNDACIPKFSLKETTAEYENPDAAGEWAGSTGVATCKAQRPAGPTVS